MNDKYRQMGDWGPSCDNYVKWARAGNKDAIATLLQKAAWTISRGEKLPEPMRIWLAECLESIANGIDPRDVFPVEKRKGKPTTLSRMEQAEVARFIHSRGSKRHKAINADQSIGAYAEAADQFSISATTAEKYYKEHLTTIKGEDNLLGLRKTSSNRN